MQTVSLHLIRNDGTVLFTDNNSRSISQSERYKLKYDMQIASCYYDTAYKNIYCER